MSLVLVCPSILMQLKLLFTACRRIDDASSDVRDASVITMASIVAMLGAIIAAPFAVPVTVTLCPLISTVRLASLCTVSVVIMPRAAETNESVVSLSFSTIGPMPAASFSRGRKCPMTPVEQTRKSDSSQPILFAASAVIQRASSIPRCPVHAFAFPELMITPRTDVLGIRSRDTCTGGSDDPVLRENPRSNTGDAGHEQGKVELAGVRLDSTGMSGCAKASGKNMSQGRVCHEGLVRKSD